MKNILAKGVNFNSLSFKLFLVAILIYLGQGVLYEGTIFTKLAAGYILLINLVNLTFYLKNRNKVLLGNLMFFFVFVNIIYWVFSKKSFHVEGEVVYTSAMIVNITFVFTTFFSFFHFAREGVINEMWLKVIAFLLLTISILNVIYDSFGGLANFLETNNHGYLIACVVPWLIFFWKKKFLMGILLVIAFIAVCISLKRGAIICVALTILITVYFMLNESFSQHKIRGYFFLAIFLCGFSFLIVYFYNDSIVLQNRIESTFEGNSSHRDSIYSSLFIHWYNSDLLAMLFGRGCFGTLDVYGQYAHNDWLELLTDMGLFGLTIYFIITCLILNMLRSKKMDVQDKCLLVSVCTYWLIRSSLSMCYYELETILETACLGYLAGKNR